MSGTLKQYYLSVRQVEARLPEVGPYYGVSIENVSSGNIGGRVCEFDRFSLAREIVASTYRLATQDEIDAWLVVRAAEGRRIQEEEVRRKQQSVMVLPPDLFSMALSQHAAAAAAAATTPESGANTKEKTK